MGAVTKVMDQIGNAIDHVFNALDPALEAIGGLVEKVIAPMAQQFANAVEHPLETIITAAGAAIGVPPYVTSAAITAAKGGSLEDIAKSAAMSYASTEFMAQTNIGADIKEFVGSVGGDFTDSMMKTFDLTPDQAVQLAKVSTAALNSSVMGGIKSALNGDSIVDGMASGFQSGLVYGSTDSFFSSINKDQNWGLSPTALNLVKGASSTALNTIISGKGDPAQAIGNYLGGAMINIGSSEFSKLAKSTYDDFTGKTALAQAAQEKYLGLQNTYQEKSAQSETLRADINTAVGELSAIKTNEADPIIEKITAAQAEQTAANTEYYAQKAKYDENKNVVANYNDEMVKRGFTPQEWSNDGIGGTTYTKQGEWDGEKYATIDAPGVETFVEAQRQAALAGNAAAEKSNAANKTAISLADTLKPIQDKLTPLQATIASKTEAFNAIKADIQTPSGNNLAAQLKTAADAYQTKYSDYAASKTAADKAAENSAKQIAAVATRDATIDSLNSGVLKVTGKDANGTYTLSNGMMLDSSGKFFQDGTPAFGDAAGVPQTKMQFADGKGNLVDFNINAGRVMSPTDVTSTLSKWFNVTATPAEAQALVDKGIDPNDFQSTLGKFTDDKAISTYKSVTGTEPTAAQVSTIRNSGTDIMTAAQQAAVNGLDLPEGYVSPGDSLATQVSRGQAYAAARLAYGPKATFDWTDPKTGVTKQYTTENAEEQTARLDKALGDAQARINLMPASEIAGAGRGFFAGKPAGVENIYYGKKDNNVYIDNRTFDAMGNVTGGGIELAPDPIATNVRATNIIAQIGATGAQGLGELLQNFANATALATGSTFDNAAYNLGKSMEQWGKDRDAEDIVSQSKNIQDAISLAGKTTNRFDQIAILAKAAKDNPLGFISDVGKEVVQEGPGMVLGLVATAFMGPLGIPATVFIRSAVSSALDGMEAFGSGGREAYDTLIKAGASEAKAREGAMWNGAIHAAVTIPAEFIADKALFKHFLSGVTGGVTGLASKVGSTVATGAITEFVEGVSQSATTQYITTGKVDMAQATAGAFYEAMIGAGTSTAMIGPSTLNDATIVAKDFAGRAVSLKDFMSGTRDVDLSTLDSKTVIGTADSGTKITLGSIAATGLDVGIQFPELKSILPSNLTSDSAVIATSADGTDITFGNLKSLETKNPSLNVSTILDDIYTMSSEDFKQTFTPSVLAGDAVLETGIDRQAMATKAGFPDFNTYQQYGGDPQLYTNAKNNTQATAAGFPDFASFTQYNGDLTAYNAAKTAATTTGGETTAATTTTGPKVKTAAELANEAKGNEIMMMLVGNTPNPNGYSLLDAQAALRGEITPTDKAIAERTTTGATGTTTTGTGTTTGTTVADTATGTTTAGTTTAATDTTGGTAAGTTTGTTTGTSTATTDTASTTAGTTSGTTAGTSTGTATGTTASTGTTQTAVAGLTTDQVTQIVNAAIAANPSLTADQVRGIVSTALASNPGVTIADVQNLISKIPAGVTTAQVQAIVNTSGDAAAAALNTAKEGLTKSIADLASGTTTSLNGIKDSITALTAAGLTTEQVNALVAAGTATVTTGLRSEITAASTAQTTALDDAKTALAKSISDLSTKTTTDTTALAAAIADLKATGLTTDQVQALIGASTLNVSDATRTAINDATKDLVTADALATAKSGLEKSIADLSTGATNNFNALTKSISDLAAAGLTEAQVKALVEAGTRSVSTDLKAAISTASGATITAIADAKTELAKAISDLSSKTTTDMTAVNKAITDLQAAGLTTDQVKTLVSAGTTSLEGTLKTAIADAATAQNTALDDAKTALTKSIADLSSKTTTDMAGVNSAIAALAAAGLTTDQVQKIVDTSSAGVTTDLKAAITAAGTAQTTALNDAKTALTQSITDLSNKTTTDMTSVNKAIADLKASGLTTEQVNALINTGTANVTTDLKAAITAANTAQATALDTAKADLTKAIGDLSSKTTTDTADLKQAISDLRAAGLTEAQVKSIVETQTAGVSTDVKAAITDASTGMATALEKAKTDLSKSITDLASGTATGFDSLKDSIAALKASGLTEAQVQKLVNAGSANVSTDLKAAIANASAEQATALDTAKAGLTKSIADLASGTSTGFETLNKSIADLKAAGLTEAQVKALVDAGAAGVTTDLKAAIKTASEAATTQIAGVTADVQAKYDAMTAAQKAEVAARQQQGIDLSSAITAESTAVQAKLAALGTDVQSQYNKLTTAQKEEVDARSLQGTTLAQAITDASQATKTQITGLSAEFQAKLAASDAATQAGFGRLTDAQKAQAEQLATTTGDLKSAIAQASATTTQQIAGVSADFQAKLAASDQATQDRFNQLTDAQKAQAAQLATSTGNLQTAIAQAAATTQTQIAGLSADIQSKYDAMTEAQKAEVAARQAQGQSLQDSITSTAAATQTQITGLSADLQAKYAAMTAAQQTEVANRQAQGQSLQDSIAATAAATQAQITGLSADLQTKYDAMTAAQKAEVAARQAQGVSLEASIQATASATQAQITGLSADLQAKYDAMTAAQKAEVANREAQGTTLADAIKTTASATQTQITNTQTQFNTRVDQLVTQGQTQQAATDTALKELNAGLLGVQTEQQAAKDTAAAAATEAKRASAQTSSNAGLAAAMGILGGTVGAVGQIGSKTAAAPVIDDTIPAYKKIGFTSTGEGAKYVSPLEQYLKQVMGDSYANPQQQAAPVNQQGSSAWSYGQDSSIDNNLGDFDSQLASSTLPEMGNYQKSMYSSKKGGLVPPLMAAGGTTRYGKYAGGGLNTVNFQGKDRIDFRTGNAVTGPGDGQSDDIPAMLADGEFVFPADVVAALGNGSTKAGSDKLYDMMHSIRSHSRSTAPKELPPPAKSPLDYLNKRARR